MFCKYSPSTSIRSVIARIYNSLVEALNDDVKLPRFIIIIPGHNILSNAAFYNFGASLVIGDNIEWIVEQTTSIVETRKIRFKRQKTRCGKLLRTQVHMGKNATQTTKGMPTPIKEEIQ